MTIKASSQITISKVIDIHACYRYYKLQGSTLAKPTKPTKNPPDGWSDTEPAYISGSTNTLYFVDCNVYSDKSFSFSEVSKSSSYEAAKDAWNKANKAQDTATNAQNKVDNLQVGGRNLIHNSKGDQTAGFFTNFDVNVEESYGEISMKSTNNYPSIDLSKGFVVSIRDYPVGEVYTWSYDIMYTAWNFPSGTGIGELWMGQCYANAPSGQTGTGTWRSVTLHSLPRVGSGGCKLNEWYHVIQKVVIPEKASDNVGVQQAIQFHGTNANIECGFTARFRNVKLEKGNKATDWTPAPEDIDNRFDTAETRITQAETSIETTNNQVALKASTETVTEIGNRANQIDKTLSDALTTIKQNSDAIASLTARDFKVEFTTITNQLTQLNGDLTAYKKEVGNWMRFDAEGNLVLGATRVPGQDAYELKLTKNRISFMLNDDEVAYISNNELYITNSTVVQNLKIGRFVWEIRGNGNLGLVWR